MAIFGKTLGELRTTSRVLWEQRPGQMHWRNNIVALGNRLYFSTSGTLWNEPDESDAVWCLDADSGATIWVVYTGSDANSISVDDGVVLVGTDGGTVWAIDANTGYVLSETLLTSPVVTRPVRIRRLGRSVALVIATDGEVIAYDYELRSWEAVGRLPFRVTASPVEWHGDLYVGTETNEVLRVRCDDFDYKVVLRVSPQPKEHYTLYPTGVQSLVLSGTNLLVSYSRETYDERPPVICLNASTGLQQWHARGVKTLSKKHPVFYGNARTSPVVWRGLLLATFAYDDSLHAFDLRTGLGKWKVKLDDGRFQNWASPVIDGHTLYVPRVNGVISTVNLETQRLEEALSVETASPHSTEGSPRKDDLDPGDRLSFGLAASPIVARGRMFVGTVAGRLLCVSL